ncbi:MAG: diguanylate cyclase [Gammaproteobacteria bacterium]|nr:diguanylate cyclase [Gammaproteobacteria bacterium]
MAALLLVGLDNFERINAPFGHVVGDRLLREFGLRLPDMVRAEDITARTTLSSEVGSGVVRHDDPVGRLGGIRLR